MTWKWKPAAGYRSHFGPEQVNTLASMVARHYQAPHEMVCVTDDPKGIDSSIRVIPLWHDHAKVPSPWGFRNPSCYRRLKVFSHAARELIGPRFVSLDLDVVITGDMRPIWDRPEDFVIWGDTAKGTPYNGGMFLLRAGTRPQVWEKFDPVRSPMLGKRHGYVGSDQAWIATCLGNKEPKWSKGDGVYSYRNEVNPTGGHLPKDARIVLFHGRHDPWDRDIQERHAWVREFYR